MSLSMLIRTTLLSLPWVTMASPITPSFGFTYNVPDTSVGGLKTVAASLPNLPQFSGPISSSVVSMAPMSPVKTDQLPMVIEPPRPAPVQQFSPFSLPPRPAPHPVLISSGVAASFLPCAASDGRTVTIDNLRITPESLYHIAQLARTFGANPDWNTVQLNQMKNILQQSNI